MATSQLRSANFGSGHANLTGSAGVGYTLLASDGSTFQTRTTSGVYQLVSGSGMYACFISFPDQFNGSILWDTAETGSFLAYATEQYNTEENDPRVFNDVEFLTGSMNVVSGSVSFLYDMEGGRWRIDQATNRMLFYKSDNATVVASFDLLDASGAPSVTSVFERKRV